MTQIVAAGNWSYAIVVADRRFTVNGVLVDEQDDERNKLIVLATRTARLGAAFCGLARLGTFETERWLSALLLETSQAGGGTPDLELFCRRATNQFAQFRVGREADKCLWIVLAGFVSEQEGISPRYAFISNADATADGWRAVPFHYEVVGPTNEAEKAYAMSLGSVRVTSASVDGLKSIVDEDSPPVAARGAAIRLLAQARRDPIDGGRIGDRSGAVVVWSDPSRQPQGHYLGRRGAVRHFMPTLVTSRDVLRSVAIDRPRMVAARNAPCPCGSGRPFRTCHGACSSSVEGWPVRRST